MTIKERFKEKHPRIYARILECQREQDNTPNDELDLVLANDEGNFLWENTTEGQDFWENINDDTTEEYKIFYEKYPEETTSKPFPEKWAIDTRKPGVKEIVGKWYKNLGNNCIGKLCREVTTHEFPCTEYLDSNKKYINTGNYFANYKNAELLTDLFEIQKYLPDGHVDKVSNKVEDKPEFKVGKWYKVVDANCWGKFLKFKGDSFYASEHYVLSYYKDFWEFSTGCTWIPATDEELQQFLPANHPDLKVQTKTETMEGKFQKGDYVVSQNEDVILIYPNEKTTGIRISSKALAKNNTFMGADTKLRLATQEEKDWLDRCIAAGRYVEKEIKTETKEEFKVGNSYLWQYKEKDKFATLVTESTVEEPIDNQFGLKIGDKLPQDVINKWTEVGNNYCQIIEKEWRTASGRFIGDRIIKGFKMLHGHLGFLVSDTNDVYLRVEGFKYFMDTFNPSVKEYPLTPQESYKPTETTNNQISNNNLLLLPTKEIYVRKSKNN